MKVCIDYCLYALFFKRALDVACVTADSQPGCRNSTGTQVQFFKRCHILIESNFAEIHMNCQLCPQSYKYAYVAAYRLNDMARMQVTCVCIS